MFMLKKSTKIDVIYYLLQYLTYICSQKSVNIFKYVDE